MEKLCPDCGRTKPLGEFVGDKRRPTGRGTYCRPCHRVRCKEARDRRLERDGVRVRQLEAAAFRRSMLKRRGLTPETFDAMLAAQGGVCAICGSDNPKNTNWSIDHCHDTGRTRGILCNGCNLMLGHARDNPTVLSAAIVYLA